MTAHARSLSAGLGALRETGEAAGRSEQVLTICRSWLSEFRQKIKEEFFNSGDVTALLVAQTAMMDQLLLALFDFARGKSKSGGISVVAVGGYGRGELFPYSDIDLLFLFDPKQAEKAAQLAESILYVLWDLGLKVGQAHRSVEETLTLAREDITIRTTLLDARRVAGSPEVFEEFSQEFSAAIEGDPLEFVEAKLAERDARHLRFGDSRYMLEPNVKEGKGGLRDLHTLWWLARYAYPIESLRDLVTMELLTAEEYHNFDQARQFLWLVRAWLHYLSERAEDRLTFDRQHAIAVHMGYDHPSINRSIERFMRRYFVAVRTVGSMTRVLCALLEDEKKRKPRLRALPWQTNAPWRFGHFRLKGERINVRIDYAFEQQPLLMLELFYIAQEYGLDIHPRSLRLINRNLRLVDDKFRHDPRACAMFLNILLSKKDPEVALRRMSEAGLLGRFIPDFGRVVGQTQFNMYHVYTVDEHTLVAIGLLHALEQGRMKKEAPLASDLIGRIQMRRVLYLSLFCHDIAKGQGGDHSQLGEKVVTRLAQRLGFSDDETETAAWLVRQHLLFSNTAFKRDLNDPKTITDFVTQVQTSERLRLLLILTVADIRAVGPAVWNEWKASLLRDLYTRADQLMGTGSVVLKHHERHQFREKLLSLLPGWEQMEIEAYLEQGNAAFWAACDLTHHAAIARLLRQSAHLDRPLLFDTRHDNVRQITEIIIVTPDQNRLFSQITGAMALGGANIINAKIFTLKNGMAVEIFQVQDAGGVVFDRADRLAKLSVYIEQALSGELDLAPALFERGLSYRRSNEPVNVPGQVFIENNASNIHTVIELTGHDRVGFLYNVTQAIAGLGLSIATAHISTYGTQVADVFYVKDIFGMKISHEAKQKEVREALLKAISHH